MTDAILLEASLFSLNTAIGTVDDPMFKAQLRLSMDVLANAVAAVGQSLSPATVNDLEFALNDVAGAVGELGAEDAAAVAPALAMMQADVETLKQATALPDSVIAAVRAFQTKLRARKSAVERQTYKEKSASDEPLPHPPAELAAEAVPLRQQLATGGFATPALDELIAEPESLRFHSIGDILDELDVIVG